MARISYVESLLAGMPADSKRALRGALEYVLDNLRFGRADHATRAENGQYYFFETVTPAVANQEFTIPHGLAAAPYLLIPVLSLTVPGEQIVPLFVTRAADPERIYLSSPVANAAIRVMVEV